MAVVNYSKYINYCEININCVTSKSLKLKYRSFVHFSSTIFCLKFSFGMMRGQKDCAGLGIGANKTCGDGVGIGTRSAGWGGDGDEQLSRAAL